MATATARPFEPDFSSQLNIESLIAAPLIAASKANVVMVTGQTRALLENCFEQKTDGNYEPVMINMVLTRSSIAPGEKETGKDASLTVTKLVFSVPVMCIVPINNLVVDKVTVDFDLEITSVHHDEATGLADGDPINKKKAVLHGKIANRPSGKGDSNQPDSTARLKVNINAGPLPLPPGLLTVLDLYTKSILPMPPQK